MPGEGLEPPSPRRAPGFKPGASTSSATPAGRLRLAGLRRLQLHRAEEGSDGCAILDHRRTRQRREERTPIGLRSQARIEDRHDTLILVATNQPPEPLPQLEHRGRE